MLNYNHYQFDNHIQNQVKQETKMFKILIIINLLLIIISLFSGMFFLVNDDGKKNRIVTSLTIRVGLSISLICLLLVGYYSGAIQPNAL